MPIIPAYDPNNRYAGWEMFYPGTNEWRYRVQTIESVLREDDETAMAEIVAERWVDTSTRAFCGETLVHYANHRGATRCAQMLRAAGFPE